jgi:hypothetical protein
MSNHLSHDQISRCVLGQASAEEEEHGLRCPHCSAELVRFTEAVSTFQSVMKNWSEAEPVPQLEKTPNPLPWRRWAVAGVAVAVLAAIPIYERRARQPVPEPETNADELLMEEVAAHLSRPLPISMERVMVLLPEVEQGNAPEREEVR